LVLILLEKWENRSTGRSSIPEKDHDTLPAFSLLALLVWSCGSAAFVSLFWPMALAT